MSEVVGLLLAAGAGRRMGCPKALVSAPDGTPWVVTSARVLREGGCARVVVVVGAEHERVRAAVEHEPVTVVHASDWESGMGASLRAGLAALTKAQDPAEAVLVHLVDLPDVGAAVIRRVADSAAPQMLARARFGDGGPGHPVLLGRAHWLAVAEQAAGDVGARSYLAAREVRLIDCADLAGGADVDHRGS